MSEMLGNQYFMARKFELALQQFVDVLEREPNNFGCIKKTIICYTQMKQLPEALSWFQRIMDIDPFIIINTRPEDDDCPCPELVVRIEEIEPSAEKLVEHYNILGILYLYCNVEKSLHYFQASLKVQPEQNNISSIINQLHHIIKVQKV